MIICDILTYPAIIVLVKHANKLAGFEFQLIFHARLELELYTMHVVRPASSNRHSSCSGNLSRSRGRRPVATLHRSIAVRVDAVCPVMACARLLRQGGSIAEGVLLLLLLCVTSSQVREELSDRTKAKTRCGGGSLCACAAESVTVGAEAVDGDRCSTHSTLLVVLLEFTLALLTAPAEEDQTKDESKTEDDSNCKTSFCATSHSSLLGFGSSTVGGAERSANDHARCVVGELSAPSRCYVSRGDGR